LFFNPRDLYTGGYKIQKNNKKNNTLCFNLRDFYLLGVFNVSKHVSGRAARHHALNDVLARAFSLADIPVVKKTAGLLHTDGKRPDGMTLVPLRTGKPVV